MAKRKTRITVTLDGQTRQLFSIKENKAGELFLLLADSVTRQEDEGKDKTSVVEDHYSVHLARRVGTLVKHTTIFSNRRTETTAQFVHHTDSDFCCVVVAVLCGDLGHPPYDHVARSNDRDVQVGAFLRRHGKTLCYAIVAADLGRQLPEVPKFNLTTIKFEKRKLGVYVSYVATPAYETSFKLVPATSARQTDGVFGPEERKIINSATNEDVIHVINHTSNRLMGIWRQYLRFTGPTLRGEALRTVHFVWGSFHSSPEDGPSVDPREKIS